MNFWNKIKKYFLAFNIIELFQQNHYIHVAFKTKFCASVRSVAKMGNVIETNQLTKKFGSFTAVDRLNITVESGEIFGLLGPNGAGKTTAYLCYAPC